MPSLTILAKALLATLGFICWYQKLIIWVYDFDRFLLLDVLHWPFIVLCWLLFVPYLLLIMLLWLLVTLKSSRTKFYKNHVLTVCSFLWHCLQTLFSALRRIAPWLHSLVHRTSTSVVDPEAQPPDQNLDAGATNYYFVKLELQDTLTSSLEAPSTKW
ncbi:hypothetical protein F4604DRAFT_1674563 [Suillus subluteus]|nr:hypothetical protein F4604DRAFT_1674563 [Suillus subluteus]